MTRVIINGEKTLLKEPIALSQYLDQQGYQIGQFALAINHQFIPREKYEQIWLTEGDQIEIVKPLEGG